MKNRFALLRFTFLLAPLFCAASIFAPHELAGSPNETAGRFLDCGKA